MTETWLPDWERQSGPAWKQGYAEVPSRELSLIEGDVKHSMEGGLQAAMGVLHGPRQASWHFSVPTTPLASGKLGYQHYPLEAVTWHAGLAGDRKLDTSLIGNLTLVGIEHEGVAGEPLTRHQLLATIDLSWRIRTLTHAGTNPPELRRNLWEHNWLSATACPSGRIPWNAITTQLKTLEDDLTDAEKKKLFAALSDILAYVTAENDIYVSPEGQPEIYRLDEANQRLVHAVNWSVYTEQTPYKGKSLPVDHPIWRLETVYPGGVPKKLLS